MQWFAKDLVPDRRALGAAFTMAFAVAACARARPVPLPGWALAQAVSSKRSASGRWSSPDRRWRVAYRPSYASAELYDPHIGAFAATGSMTATRTNQAAVLLRTATFSWWAAWTMRTTP